MWFQILHGTEFCILLRQAALEYLLAMIVRRDRRRLGPVLHRHDPVVIEREDGCAVMMDCAHAGLGPEEGLVERRGVLVVDQDRLLASMGFAERGAGAREDFLLSLSDQARVRGRGVGLRHRLASKHQQQASRAGKGAAPSDGWRGYGMLFHVRSFSSGVSVSCPAVSSGRC